MKKIIFGLALVLSIGFIVPTFANAQENDESTSSLPDAASENAVDKTEKRQERIDAYKARVEARLSAAQERKITNSCKAAQTITARLSSELEKVKQRRQDAYTSVSEKLATIVEKLKLAEVDQASVTLVETAIADFNTQAESFLAAIDEYQVTIDDLTELDCESDPEAFQAALTSAKEQRVQLINSSQALRKYLNDTIKPLLSDIRESISSNEEEEA